MSARPDDTRQLTVAMRVLGAWIIVVAIFFTWQAIEYAGLIRRLAEAQFLEYETYWPTLTVVAVSTLFALPAIAIVWITNRRSAKAASGSQTSDAKAAQRLLVTAGRLTWLFTIIAAVSLGAAALSLILLLRVPGDAEPAQSIVVGSPDADRPVEGLTTLTGNIDVMETAQFNEDLLLFRRTYYFAPVRSSPDDRTPIRYFVEVRRNDIGGNFHVIPFPQHPESARVWRYRVPTLSLSPYTRGVLRRDGLPGEIVLLYRHAGYDVADETYVLFRSRERIQWRYYMLAGQFALSALIAGLCALFLRRRERRIADRVRAALG